jgi:nucleotide-binding universal stress UspA family protein
MEQSMTNEAHESGRIVVGVDGSKASRDALVWAGHQAELTGASLQVIMTWHVPTAAYGAQIPMPSDYDFMADSQRELTMVVEQVLGERPDIGVSMVVVEGHPANKLIEASVGAELLVVGSRGHGAFAGMLLGSVSEHCVAHASCPVVVVRHSPHPA